MVQIRTIRRLQIRSASDIRWLLAMTFGVLISIAYYAGLIWLGLWAVRAVMGWISGA